MKIAIMQPYIFPYIGYFQLINAVDKFILYDDVNYINKGWINRNNLLVNKESKLFTIPLSNASQNKKINQITISQEGKWKQNLAKTIEQHYKKAPYFDNVFSIIMKSIYIDFKDISKFNFYSISTICQYLEITTTIIPSSSTYKNEYLKGQDRIIDICKLENAKTYINPIGGRELYHSKSFEENRIDLRFIKPTPNEYPQNTEKFIPFLSIIDVIMFNSKDTISRMLTQFELI